MTRYDVENPMVIGDYYEEVKEVGNCEHCGEAIYEREDIYFINGEMFHIDCALEHFEVTTGYDVPGTAACETCNFSVGLDEEAFMYVILGKVVCEMCVYEELSKYRCCAGE